jgi:hypothetical protein
MTTEARKTCACGQPRHNGAKCRECYNMYMRDYMASRRKNHTGGARGYDLRTKYGITLNQYSTMLLAQNGQCAICGADDPGANKVFEVDHDHACCDKAGSCGSCVRGLLCTSCNTGIARFKDNPDTLLSAIKYLQAWTS